MSKVNGNDGNNNDLMKGLQAYYEAIRAKAAGKANKPAEVKADIPIGKQNGIQHTEMGDDLLTASFYPDVQFSKKINSIKAEPGSLEELQQTLPTLTVANADRADKKAAYNAVPGNEPSDWLIKAYAYGPLQTPEEESGVQTTKDYVLNNIDILDSIVSFA